MTMTADHTLEQSPAIGIPHTLNGGRLMMRIAQRIGAVTFAFVMLLVWLAPGEAWESDVMLFKMVLTLASLAACIWLWQSSQPPLPPTIEVDVAQSELRLVREGVADDKRIIERCAFADLHLVELAGRHITFWGKGNRLLAEITLSNSVAHASLVGALRAEGKLA